MNPRLIAPVIVATTIGLAACSGSSSRSGGASTTAAATSGTRPTGSGATTAQGPSTPAFNMGNVTPATAARQQQQALATQARIQILNQLNSSIQSPGGYRP